MLSSFFVKKIDRFCFSYVYRVKGGGSNMEEQKQAMVENVLTQYGDMLFRIALSMLKNQSDAEDALSETLLRYIQKAPSFAGQEHEKAWLIRVLSNICKDIVRRQKRHGEIPLSEMVCSLPVPQEERDILDALMQVDEKYRIVLLLYYVEGYSTKDIAKLIGKTVSCVKMRLQKGRKLLEQRYRKENEYGT